MTTTGTEPSRTPAPEPRRPRPAASGPRRKSKRAAKPTPPPERSERRYVQTVRSIDIWSVCRISVGFYLCLLIVALCVGVVLWWIAIALGAVGNVEQFVGDLFNNDDFRLLSWAVLRSVTLIGLAWVCVATVVTVLFAALYNLFAEVFGGIEVTIAEQEVPTP
ncbi:MAG: DUF3566 domain-containing protein [Actinomycetota bacterium]